MSGLTGLIRGAVATVELVEANVSTSDPVPVTAWEDRGGRLFAEVRFGPFPLRVAADAVLLTLNGETERVELPGRISLPADTSFTYELTIGVHRG